MLVSSLLAFAASISSTSAVYQGFNYGSTRTDGSAKLQAEFQSDFTTAQGLVGHSGFSSARLYTMIQAGTANDVIQAIPAAIATKTSLLLGLWASAGESNIQNEIIALKAAISTYGTAFTDLIASISVGSEDLYRISSTGVANKAGIGAEPQDVVNYIGQVRSAIAGTVASGALVGHVDTWTAWVNSSNNAVIDAVDFIGMDAYPYFQPNDTNPIENAASLFFKSYNNTIAVSKGKPVWITETGWPVNGPLSGQAVASVPNAEKYWQAVACKILGNIHTFWYTLQDADPTTPSTSFGLVGSTLTTAPLYDLACSAASSSPSVSSTAPVSSAPVSSAHVSSAPANSAPASSAPASSAPVSSAPASSAPVSSAPASSAPVSSALVSSAPASSAPASSAPASSVPASAAPASSAPASSAPASSVPASAAPASAAPASSAPASSAPASSAPVSAGSASSSFASASAFSATSVGLAPTATSISNKPTDSTVELSSSKISSAAPSSSVALLESGNSAVTAISSAAGFLTRQTITVKSTVYQTVSTCPVTYPSGDLIITTRITSTYAVTSCQGGCSAEVAAAGTFTSAVAHPSATASTAILTVASAGSASDLSAKASTPLSPVGSSAASDSAASVFPTKTSTPFSPSYLSAPASTGSACPNNLSGEYQYPHLIVPVDSTKPKTAYGTSYFGHFSPTISTIFNFDIPGSYTGKTCTLVFLLPIKSQLETSSYTLSGSGGINVYELVSAATQQTTYDTVPATAVILGSISSVVPGNAYTITSYACGAGLTESFEVSVTGSLDLEYFQDYNPCPLGMYIIAS